ncbi:MAG: T9SS type A sorting domain-containing protein [Bacteroidetes bacterium]|nr:T9SS type A sorting domain-containing protein [Bacteroidota bacterium]
MNLTINAAKQTTLTVNVYDLTGRIVISKNFSVGQGASSHVLDITNLSSGTYVIKANDGNSFATSKMVRY